MTRKLTKTFLTIALATSMLTACGVSGQSNTISEVKTTHVAVAEQTVSNVTYGREDVNGVDIFYRQAGDPSKQAVVLLHGFPSSSHMYREVLDDLGDEYYVIAPDYPSFGDSEFPPSEEYEYTFDNLAKTMNGFLEQKGISNYVLMIQDYGAPVGMRIAADHPERVDGLISMNGNVYEEGINELGWGPVIPYWSAKTPELEAQIIENVFSLEALEWQYTHGTRNPDNILPDNWTLDFQKLNRPGAHRAALDLFYDYQENIKRYPEWQQYLRDNQPPMLVIWGKNDAFFPPAGAEGFKKDVKNLDFYLLDTGHFALEEEAPFIIDRMQNFLSSL